MKFKEVIGAKNALLQVQELVHNEGMPHAMLISGPVGNSKLALALAYVAGIMCEDRHEGEACGACRACKKTFKFVHPDVHFSFPFFGANETSDSFIKSWRSFLEAGYYGNISDWLSHIDASTKQANINVKECRSIIQKLNMQSFESEKKVLVMWLPEYLKKEGNRLLKLIEEPTPNTYFVLITERPMDILPTILSRCQLVKVPPLLDEEIETALQTSFGVSPPHAKEMAFIAEGNMNKALELVKQGGKALHQDVLQWFRLCYSNNAHQMLQWVDDFAKKAKDDQKQFLEYALNFMREVGRVPLLPSDQLRIQENEIETAKKMAGILTFEKIEKLNNILTDTIYYIERNANIRILMTDTNISFKNVLRAS